VIAIRGLPAAEIGDPDLLSREEARVELRRLFEACELDGSPAGPRDAAIFALGYGLGLRRAEIAAVRLGDYRRDAGELDLVGKGRRWARTYVTSNGTAQALDAWLAVRGAGEPDEPLLLPATKGGELVRGAGRFSAHAVGDAVRKRARQAGVGPLTPHDLRRSFVTHLRRAGVDLELRRRLARHSSVVTTSGYDRGNDEEARSAVAALRVTYVGRAARPS